MAGRLQRIPSIESGFEIELVALVSSGATTGHEMRTPSKATCVCVRDVTM
jgi:hypothetical protein